MSKDPLVEQLLTMKLSEKFEEFFKEPGVQAAVVAFGPPNTIRMRIIIMRELLMTAYVAGAEALSEMLREGEERQTNG